MPDKFTQVSHKSYGSKVGNSFKGIVFGLLLFVLAFPLLYWNEGRQDVSEIAATATEISSEAANTDSSLEGGLISTTGTMTAADKLGDNFLQEGEYVALKREVEMYAWAETVEEESDENLGGSETVTTTYEYDTEWVEDVADSSDFEYPEEHYNPGKSVESADKKVSQITVGIYQLKTDGLSLPEYSSIALDEKKAILAEGSALASTQYLFIGNGSLENPQVGDMRISYSAILPGQEVTAFGKLSASEVKSYTDEDNNTLYRVFTGSREAAIGTMHTEYTTLLWILRGVGFLMMWIGLGALFGPISSVLSFIPFLGNLSKSIVGLISFVASLVLTIATVIVSMILHNLIALLVVLGVLIVVIVVVVVLFVKKKKPTPAT